MTPRKALLRAGILAFLVFIALFSLKFLTAEKAIAPVTADFYSGAVSFEMGRKNYASQKLSGGGVTPVDAQKYEKVATIGHSTSDFDADRAKVDALIASSGGITQYERQQGLTGHRTLQLGIGVPPAKFDSFVEEARKIAKITSLAIVKTDKTNEYRQLRAKRESLEKALKALTDMAGAGGSVDERLKVQARLSEIEDKIQDLGVSLGDFNAENEFCTVKLTLAEIEPSLDPSAVAHALGAFFWALEHFIYLAVGFLFLTFAAWLGAHAVEAIARAWRKHSGD
jgi:hypothetical protein